MASSIWIKSTDKWNNEIIGAFNIGSPLKVLDIAKTNLSGTSSLSSMIISPRKTVQEIQMSHQSVNRLAAPEWALRGMSTPRPGVGPNTSTMLWFDALFRTEIAKIAPQHSCTQQCVLQSEWHVASEPWDAWICPYHVHDCPHHAVRAEGK